MTISIITAWLAVICLVFTAALYIAKRANLIRRPFRKYHILAGHLLILFGLIHGIFAGNVPGTSLSQAVLGSQLFSLNPGTLCLILAVALGLTYKMRRVLKKLWIRLHRVLTVCILAVLVFHLTQTGITLPSLFTVSSSKAPAAIETSAAEETIEESDVETTAAAETTANTSEATEKDTETTSEASETTSESTEAEAASTVTFSGATLQDGVYEGSAQGYKSEITVQVTVEGGAVTDIEILSENDTPKYFQKVTGLPDTIVSEQSLTVDTVSGATYSSKGILDAVYNALQDAVIDGTLEINEITISDKGHGHGQPH